jgi:pilus assembly protein FimV
VVTIVKERSVRNLTKTLAVVSILAPASAHPLGIGDIKLLSALNQNLNAEIALILSGEKPSDITVHLAPPDKFNEAGVPWSYFLSKIKFETIVKPNGSVIIKLTSNEALKEPFLDLLLEVSWPKGNLYREFTVLVDPPSVYKEATIPVLTSPERYQPDEQYALPQRRTSSGKPRTHFATKGEYGPTRRNDTLWKVAEQTRPGNDISVEQMMIALYEVNPRAFYQQNVNALSSGRTLKVPEREAILKLSRKQALAEFNRQTTAWKNHLVPTSADTAPVKEEALDNQLSLNAPAEAVVHESAVVAPGSEQVAAGNEKSSSGVSSQANDAIQGKIDALEKQLAAMQQIISLKDQQLAELQNQTQDEPAKLQPAVQAEPSPQPAPVKQEVPVKPETPVQEPIITKTDNVLPVKPDESASTDQEQSVKPATPSVVKSVPPAKSPVTPPAQPKTESSSDVTYPIAVGISAAILSAFGLLWWRKRKVEEEMNTESMFASAAMIKAAGSGADLASDITTNHSNSSAAESGFLSEFSTTDFGSFDIDQSEIDPLSEADVYLAYGRYHQAEELIQHAIKDFPARDDCKLKLLEIFHATENKVAFESYAKELAESGKDNDLQFWAKVSEMASDICPGSSLFATQKINFGADLTLSPEKSAVILDKKDIVRDDEEEKDDLSFAVTSPSINPVISQETAIAKDSELDFDLSSFTDKDDKNNSVANDQKNNTSIDFDLSTFIIDESPVKEIESSINLAKDRTVDFEFDSMADTEDSFADPEPIESIDFDISPTDTLVKNDKKEMSSDAEIEEYEFSFEDPKDLNEEDEHDVDDSFEFNFDLPMDKSNDEQEGLGVSDLTDMDELETKLDLARAYIDMGDEDSAKDIVKEVLKRGTAEQQKVAQLLMIDLG